MLPTDPETGLEVIRNYDISGLRCHSLPTAKLGANIEVCADIINQCFEINAERAPKPRWARDTGIDIDVKGHISTCGGVQGYISITVSRGICKDYNNNALLWSLRWTRMNVMAIGVQGFFKLAAYPIQEHPLQYEVKAEAKVTFTAGIYEYDYDNAHGDIHGHECDCAQCNPVSSAWNKNDKCGCKRKGHSGARRRRGDQHRRRRRRTHLTAWRQAEPEKVIGATAKAGLDLILSPICDSCMSDLSAFLSISLDARIFWFTVSWDIISDMELFTLENVFGKESPWVKLGNDVHCNNDDSYIGGCWAPSTLEACQASCLADPTCRYISWVPYNPYYTSNYGNKYRECETTGHLGRTVYELKN